MRVLKFGGTSVGSPQGRENICDFALSEPMDERVVVVVSALGGITDMLLWLCKEAASGVEAEYNQRLEEINARHRDAIEKSIPEREREGIWEKCQVLLSQLRRRATQIASVGKYSAEDEANVVAFGERLSSLIMAQMIEGAAHIDSIEVVKTHRYFSRHIVDFVATNTLLQQRFKDIKERIVVMGGFISSDTLDGTITNLGRGGSDYTAAVVAAALGAKELYIYTDVDGFLSCDPRIVPEAQLLDELSFTEAMELCNFGAKVLYAPTLFPAYNAEIPIIIRSTLNKECRGTTITKDITPSAEYRPAKGISSINDSALITLRGGSSQGLLGVNYRIFRSLCSAGIQLYMVSENSEENSTSVALKNGDTQSAIEILCKEFSGEIERGEIETPVARRNLSTLAIVGAELAGNEELSADIYSTLKSAGFPILASRQGATAENIAFVSELWALRDATQLLHRKLFTKTYETLTLYINGDNELSTALIRRLWAKRSKIALRYGLRFKITRNLEELSSPECENGVFVECDPKSTQSYQKLIDSEVSVVTAVLSRAESATSELREKALQRGVKVLYGATVAGGLPVLDTLRKLLNSGDTVTSIEAYLGDDLQGVAAQMKIMARECAVDSFEVSDNSCEGEGKVVARMEIVGGEARCTLSRNDSAIYGEAGNVVLIESARYRELPLQIRDFGEAGIESCTRALFSDILEVADIDY